jgi:hypothetical protein
MSAAFVRPGPLYQLAEAPTTTVPGERPCFAEVNWDQSYYVVDRSYPGTDNKHSEKNILDHLDTLNEQREESAQYEPLSMYTDREPCGKGGGYANCARLISERMPGVDVFYGTGYRKEADIVSPEDVPENEKTHKRQFEDDLNKNLKRLGKVWIRTMTHGGLQSTGSE